MKQLKQRLIMVLIICFFLLNPLKTHAMTTGFTTEDLSEEKKNTVIVNTELKFLAEEPSQKSIVCFDVNENGMIAIGQISADGTATICIYSSQGVFQYGYHFLCEGDLGVEWDKSNVNIYFVRSDIIVSVDPLGEILDVVKTPSSPENNSYLLHTIYSTKCVVGDTKYTIRNDMGILNFFSSSYSQLVMTNSEGEETVLYDVNSSHVASILIIGICMLMIFALCFYLGLQGWKEYKNRTQKSNNT